jgi:predicted enzyme related to lactoylglutathione lyase
MSNNGRVDYLEITVLDVAVAKAFYGQAFGWTFEDFGTEYASWADGRLNGGFRKEAKIHPGGTLTVLYADDLEDMLARVKAAGGWILKEPFEFPGGRRFHFADPSGNELAVWGK